uniref:Uncharacterized protein n=1 Tax=Psilocybe cubensis TaxID=181762 RepID=A0A8H7Y6K3_PSICU
MPFSPPNSPEEINFNGIEAAAKTANAIDAAVALVMLSRGKLETVDTRLNIGITNKHPFGKLYQQEVDQKVFMPDIPQNCRLWQRKTGPMRKQHDTFSSNELHTKSLDSKEKVDASLDMDEQKLSEKIAAAKNSQVDNWVFFSVNLEKEKRNDYTKEP